MAAPTPVCFVAGATGFVGREVVARLAPRARVIARTNWRRETARGSDFFLGSASSGAVSASPESSFSPSLAGSVGARNSRPKS